ncbi:MAG TPA: galactokinase family protein [Thermodesulfobacteriota bacterium]|nr:galactokinase family protein [Thermodesulfobacteriota bacterium]
MEFPSLLRQKERLLAHLKKRERFVEEDLNLVVSPYRICPIGAHIDHQGGPVLGMTINAYTILAFIPNEERRVRLYSVNYPGVVEFNLGRIRTPARNDWGKYAMGAAKVIGDEVPIRYGFIGALIGTLPASGLSSSASIGLAYLHALAMVNGLKLTPSDYIELDRRLENDYLKLKNGILDQATILHGKREHLLHIDTITGDVEPLSKPEGSEGFRIIVAYSGFSRELASSGFNTRVEECRRAVILLGLMGGVMSAKVLSEIPEEVFRMKSKKLPETLRRRTSHFYSEVRRVRDGVRAWQEGDWEAFGRLMKESCLSSFENYESGSPELKSLQEIVSSTHGVYGSRFSGGGYGGCVIGLVRHDIAEDAASRIYEAYLDRYPELKGRAAVYLADSEDGVRFI